MKSQNNPIPVILDTDIGDDIDDTWALAMLLNSPELDVRLIVTSTNNTPVKAKIVAKMLEVAGRTDIPIGIGLRQNDQKEHQEGWVSDYDMAKYPGKVLPDGIDAMIRAIMNSLQPITLIAIGPVTNVAEALKREPLLAPRARFVGMHGSMRKGYGYITPVAEYNVVKDTAACQHVFTAPWRDITITPLDTCELVRLKGELYQKLLRADNALVKAIIEGYRAWAHDYPTANPDLESTVLHDCVAIHLALPTNYLKMEKMGVRVTDDGYTVHDPSAQMVNVAMEWNALNEFQDALVERLLGSRQS